MTDKQIIVALAIVAILLLVKCILLMSKVNSLTIRLNVRIRQAECLVDTNKKLNEKIRQHIDK